MTDKLIEHSIKPGEFRVKRASRPESGQEQKSYDRFSKNMATALKGHTMIGIDTDGFEVWVS